MKEEITMNGVELHIHTYEMKENGKRVYEVYTHNTKTKMFINESLKTKRVTKVSVWLDGYNIQLSPKYDYGMAIHIFTDLFNKLKIKSNIKTK